MIKTQIYVKHYPSLCCKKNCNTIIITNLFLKLLLKLSKSSDLMNVWAAQQIAVELVKMCTDSKDLRLVYFNGQVTENIFVLIFNTTSTLINNDESNDALATESIGPLTASILLASSDTYCFKRVEKFLCTLLVSSKNSKTLFLVINCWFSIARTSDPATCLKLFQTFVNVYRKTPGSRISPLQYNIRLIVEAFYMCLTKKQRQDVLQSGDSFLQQLDVCFNNKCDVLFKEIERRIDSLSDCSLQTYNETVSTSSLFCLFL